MNGKFVVIFASACALTIFCHFAAGEEKKKLKLVLDKMEKVKDSEHIVKTELTFDKADDGKEVLINGIVETFTDLDDNYKIYFDILHSKEKEGEMKKVLGIADKGACEILKNQYKNMFYDSLKKHCNAPDPEVCPMPKDKYKVDKYPLDSSKFSKYLRPGFYHIVGTLVHNNEEIFQYRVEAHTEEAS